MKSKMEKRGVCDIENRTDACSEPSLPRSKRPKLDVECKTHEVAPSASATLTGKTSPEDAGGSNVGATELASAFALASLATLNRSSPGKQIPLHPATAMSKISADGSSAELPENAPETRDAEHEDGEDASTSSWETGSAGHKEGPVPISPDVRSPLRHNKRVTFAPDIRDPSRVVSRKYSFPPPSRSNLSPGGSRMPPGFARAPVSPRPIRSQGAFFTPTSGSPSSKNNSPCWGRHSSFSADRVVPQVTPAGSFVSTSPSSSASSSMMPPPPPSQTSANHQHLQQHHSNQWICDYCNVASFATYQEACIHEESCRCARMGTSAAVATLDFSRSRQQQAQPPPPPPIMPAPPISPGGYGTAFTSSPTGPRHFQPYQHHHHPHRHPHMIPNMPATPSNQQFYGLHPTNQHHPHHQTLAVPPLRPSPSIPPPHHRPSPPFVRASPVATNSPSISRPAVSSQSRAWYQGCLSLSVPESDPNWLPPLHCYLRTTCVEVFSATTEAIAVQATTFGPISSGQVGVQCRFCRYHAPADKNLAAVAYPPSVTGIFDAVKRWHRVHVEVCQDIPTSVRMKLEEMEACTTNNTWMTTTREYWADSARSIGLVDTERGIRFGIDPHTRSFPSRSVASNGMMPSRSFVSRSPTSTKPKLFESHQATLIDSAPSEGSTETMLATGNLSDGESLICSDDMQLVPPYVFFLMRQVEGCHFNEADRFVARSKGPIGYPGFQCRHCHGHAGLGKYFPVSAKSLSTNSTSQNIHAHLLKCRKCPPMIKDQLLVLKEEKSKAPRLEPGWRKVFFDKIWERLHR